MKFVDFTAEEYTFVTKLLEETKATTNKDLKVLNGALLALKIASADDHYRRYVKIILMVKDSLGNNSLRIFIR